MVSLLSIAERGERLVYRVAGLPIALSALVMALAAAAMTRVRSLERN